MYTLIYTLITTYMFLVHRISSDEKYLADISLLIFVFTSRISSSSNLASQELFVRMFSYHLMTRPHNAARFYTFERQM